ncbi:MAG: AmmeMemoRadiSam system protein A [Anaerolineae bacterium]|nr:AmmeMemoRadiSam system protein A [Anaerolineae bacterium]
MSLSKTNKGHPLVELARETIEAHVRGERLPQPAALTPEMRRRAGAFVTIHWQGQLRGCIGTIGATQENVAEEVIKNAISAASHDPRFPPISVEELADLDVKVDVLGEPEPVEGVQDLDPKRYGLIVQSARYPWKRGLLLPDLEGIDTAEKQLYWTRYHKAGITDPDEPVQLFRFEVKRYT